MALPSRRTAPRRRSEYRLKRGPVLVLLLLVAVVGVLVLARSSVRPRVDVYAGLTVREAYVGTTYAFDALVCLRASSVGATVHGVQAPPGTRLGLRPDGAAPAVAFPVAADALTSIVGAVVPAGDQRCTRLLVTPTTTGTLRTGAVRVSFRYGPFGVLRSSTTVRPPVVLQVTGTGTDPRTAP